MNGSRKYSLTEQPLSAVVTLQRGIDLPQRQRAPGAVPVLGSSGIVGYHDTGGLRGPGVIVGRSGSVGKCQYVDGDYWPLNTTLYVRDFHGNHPRYVYYLLRHFDASRFASGVSVPTLNRNILSSEMVCTPDVPTQIVVADFLSTIEYAMTLQRRAVEARAEFRAAVLRKIFQEGLRGEALRDTDIGPIPKSWSVRPLVSISSILSGSTPPKGDASNWTGSIPWLSPKDMKKGMLSDTADHISPSAAAAFSQVVPANTIFAVVRGMALAKDLPVAISTVPMAFNQDLKAIMPSDSIVPHYLFYALISRKAAAMLEISSSAHGTKKLDTSSLENLMIPVPCIEEEQQSIAEMLLAVDRGLEEATRKHMLLTELFDAILDPLLSGKVDLSPLRQVAGS